MAVQAQQWVQLQYDIQTFKDIPYGTVSDFAGNNRTLKLDISTPVNDIPPDCGRPLMVIVHGGAFLAGDKADFSPSRLREDFAKRGYTTASVQYRLGQFQTNQAIHCNASGPDLQWDCLNMTDTSEWYRAFYRGVQDVHGAIRYLAQEADGYDINPENVFIVGESAGGFIAMGVGFIDDTTEILTTLSGPHPDAPLPNAIYEAPCVQDPLYHLDTSLASMKLERPDLGSHIGTLNLPAARAITIKGVGNLFGGTFNNIYGTAHGTPPALYLFHQPADLIVPFNSAKLLQGYAACATQFPFHCQLIINRPLVYGSDRIKQMLETLTAMGATTPEYFVDFTQNNASCAEQIFNPALGGHALDNYALRMMHMATFFAQQIDTCIQVGLADLTIRKTQYTVFPNPTDVMKGITVAGDLQSQDRIIISDLQGRVFYQHTVSQPMSKWHISSIEHPWTAGIWVLQIRNKQNTEMHRIICLD